ncbi:MAG TPA: pirin family protein [Nocardioides sp.]
MTTHIDVLAPREVPLGGPRAMRVRRTLPQRHRSLIGAWCFVDHYGPDDVNDSGGMVLPAHPHTGLQTASWLFDGALKHRDSVGSLATVRPGELNLMTAGRGISHTEVSTPGTTVLHGAQLWIALPDESRHVDPGFEHFAPDPVRGPGWEARVFIGSLFGVTSPVTTYTPLLGAEIMLATGKSLEIEVDGTFEHGVLLDVGAIDVDGHDLKPSELAHVHAGRTTLTVTAHDEARLLLLGGPPFGEAIVMWWNFIGRSHDEIEAYRREWQEQITVDGSVVDTGTSVSDGRFGVVDLDLAPIPAPEMPNVRLKLRQ